MSRTMSDKGDAKGDQSASLTKAVLTQVASTRCILQLCFFQ